MIVLRHAAAGDRAAWSDADRWRPLDEIGLGQSLELAGAFDGFAISRIMTSPYVRCQQTVAALAALRRVPRLGRRRLLIRTVDGEAALASSLRARMLSAGFEADYDAMAQVRWA